MPKKNGPTKAERAARTSVRRKVAAALRANERAWNLLNKASLMRSAALPPAQLRGILDAMPKVNDATSKIADALAKLK